MRYVSLGVPPEAVLVGQERLMQCGDASAMCVRHQGNRLSCVSSGVHVCQVLLGFEIVFECCCSQTKPKHDPQEPDLVDLTTAKACSHGSINLGV